LLKLKLLGVLVGLNKVMSCDAQSRGSREQGNLRAGFEGAAIGRLDVVANHLRQFAEDPQGLTRAELESDPGMAARAALVFDTRKDTRQDQLGLAWRKDLSTTSTLAVAVYGGQRDVTQFQSIPVAAQAATAHGGGVIGLDRDYQGVNANWLYRSPVGWEASAGIARERMQEDRRGWENFVRDAQGTTLGVRGALRRNERNRLRGDDAWLQLRWPLAPDWSVDAGVRRSRIAIDTRDRYLANGDDGGAVRFARTSPVAALHWHPRDGASMHVAWGRGFETPTLNELAYSPTGDGPNRDLHAALSSQWELGGAYSHGSQQWTGALFDVRTRDEIVVASSSGGRTTYRNAAGTQRRGLETGWTLRTGRLEAQLAATWLDARLRDAAGESRLPGTARAWGSAGLRYRARDALTVGIGIEASAAIEAGDGVRAPGFASVHLLATREWQWNQNRIRTFARIDNLLDRRHAASVIVAQAQGRFFEPAPGRAFVLGVQVSTGAP